MRLVTDIPVGSPPVPPGRHAAPGGWYPDPLDSRLERYWDGWQWSRNTRESDAPAASPGPHGQPVNGGPGPAPGSFPPGSYGAGQDPQGHYPPNQYPQGQYPPNPYPQNPDPQGQYPQGQYPSNPYPQGQYPPNPYPQNPYPQNAYPQSPYGAGQYPPAYPANVPGRQAVATADGVRLAGWWWRALAVVLDGIFTSLIAAALTFPVYARLFAAMADVLRESMRAAQAGQPAPPLPASTALISTTDQLTLTLVSLAVGLAYHVIFLRLKGATPGKLICGLRVVPVDQGRFTGQLAWGSVLIRAAIWVLPGAVAYLLIVKIFDSLFPLWHPKRQALHDLAARTQVVRRG